MKKISVFAMVLLLVALTFSACDKEGYNTGDGDYSYLRADFAEAYTDGHSKIRAVMTDEGDSIVLASPFAKTGFDADTIYRGVFYYNTYNDGSKEPYAFSTIPVMAVREKMPDDSVAYDPMGLGSVWKASTGRYINVALLVKTGSDEENDSSQQIRLMRDTLYTNRAGTNTLRLVFLHWRNGVPEYYTFRQYVSIPLAPLRDELSAGDSIAIRLYTYDGVEERTFAF